MGTWDVDAFGNDDAADWAFDLEKVGDLSLVEGTLDRVIGAGSAYVEAPEASEALAAIEVIARLQGNWGKRNAYTEAVDNWVENAKFKPGRGLAEKAHRVIDRILSEKSELYDLWQESGEGEFESWANSVRELKSRVQL